MINRGRWLNSFVVVWAVLFAVTAVVAIRGCVTTGVHPWTRTLERHQQLP